MSRAREFADLAGSADAGGLTGRNLIINGAMQVDQRDSATTKITGNQMSVDRWQGSISGTDQLAIEVGQSTESPDGFSNSFHFKVTTAETTLDAEELVYCWQKIEAQNLQPLQYGTSNAKSTTLSFWVRSSLTGTYSVSFYNNNPATARSNLQEYTINSADTWEYKTITIDGDTTGAYDNDNGQGVLISWILAAGSNWHGTPHTGWGDYLATDDFASANNVDFSAQTGDFYLTGVKYEVGDKATPFEHRSFGEELSLCQRYYSVLNSIDCNGYASSGESAPTFNFFFPQEMRASPTTTLVRQASDAVGSPTITFRNQKTTGCNCYISGGSNSMVGFGHNGKPATLKADAEL